MKEPRALRSDARLVVFRTWTGSTYFGAACGIARHRHLKGGFERSFIAILVSLLCPNSIPCLSHTINAP
ncbi:hypothetical protein B0H10DRAFT_2092686 [Mycena sp. CBHHK59/15]|nr:hypothetical protein B0H10DRAFT_2092686 [Mycena sp. CBHHK59/15]